MKLQKKQNLEQISHEYDSYIKTALKNFKIDHIRRNRRKWENECLYEDLPFARKENLLKTEDRTDERKIYLMNDRAFTDEMIRKAVSLLPEKKSVVITMRYYDDFSDSKIAEILGMTQRGVNSRRREALKLLKVLLEDHADEKE